ncbi:MAG: hypothetical protein KIS96_01210 [Bauldia sp.]|nr:hypothetical protein [Bauldia sp.]
MILVDWEYRPAVMVGVRAFAILGPGEGWTEVEPAEVADSGNVVSPEEFASRFGALPPLPSTVAEA